MFVRKEKSGFFIFALLLSLLLTGCSSEGISDGLLNMEDLLRDMYHAAKSIIDYEEPQPEDSIPKDIEDTFSIESVSGDLYVYNTLTDEEKLLYDEMLTCINHYMASCVVSTCDADLLSDVYHKMLADHGELFWTEGYQYTEHLIGDEVVKIDFAPNYTMTEMEKDNIQIQIDQKCDEWLSGISMSACDYDKTKYVFDLLITNVDYDLNAPNNQNIMSVFLGDATVCKGYSCAAQYMLNKLGIKTTIIQGIANDQIHSWNLVELGGAYYYMDVTWGNSQYSEGEDTKRFINYTYLNATTADIEKTHTFDVDFDLPKCDSMNDNYFYREGLYYTYLQPDVMGGWIKRAYEAKEIITLKLDNDSLYRETLVYFVDDNHILDYCKGIKGIKYLIDEDERTITFRFDEEYVPGEDNQ